MIMKPLLIVGIGGALGSIFRYLIQVSIGKLTTLTFPVGTLIVNLTGCFVIGLLFGLSARQPWMTFEWQLFLFTGICGGYTTFSGFSLESVALLREGNYSYFFLYILASVVVGLLATIAGIALTR
jgi:CrcB protein